TLGSAATSYLDSGLANGTYWYSVTALDLAGTSSHPSFPQSGTVGPTTAEMIAALQAQITALQAQLSDAQANITALQTPLVALQLRQMRRPRNPVQVMSPDPPGRVVTQPRTPEDEL